MCIIRYSKCVMREEYIRTAPAKAGQAVRIYSYRAHD